MYVDTYAFTKIIMDFIEVRGPFQQFYADIYDKLPIEELWSRLYEQGDAQAALSASFVFLVAYALDDELSGVVKWITEQDDAELLETYGMSDGRDIMIFERQHTLQTADEARAEYHEALHQRLLARNIIVLPDQ